MTTITLGWGTIAALLAWSGFVFWLGRASARTARPGDLTGPPPGFAAPVAGPPHVSGHSAPRLAPEALAAIRAELARGNKINAIKMMREATGLGLAEAKRAVEAMQA